MRHLIGFSVLFIIYNITDSFTCAIFGYVIYLLIKFIWEMLKLKRMSDDPETFVDNVAKSKHRGLHYLYYSYSHSILIACIVIYIFYHFCNCGKPTNESKTLPNDVTKIEIERDLTDFLSVWNASCPIDIDQVTITDSLTYDSIRNIIVYHNTILLKLSVHDSGVKAMKSFSTNQLPIDYETDPDYALFRELRIGIEHRVRDIRGNDLFSVTVH